MGVIGLWNLIEDSGTQVNVSTLQNKVLAIDLSIWINQSIKGFRDKDGKAVENAHLLGLFHRICKLLFYKIKPIFVFDGESPTLKFHTIQRRKERSRKMLEKTNNFSLDILEKYVNSQVVDTNGRDSFSTFVVNAAKNKLKLVRENTFLSESYLPHKQVDIYSKFVELKEEFKNCIDEDESNECNSDSNISQKEESEEYINFFQNNLFEIDFNSDKFKSLPAAKRYELLVDLREEFKQRKNSYPEILPIESNSFSEFQMKKLLKKRNLQEEIDKLIDELNGFSSEANFELLKSSNFMNSNFSNATFKMTGGQLASDEKTRFLFCKSSSSTLNPEISQVDSNNELENEKDCFKSEIENNNAYSLPNCLPGQEINDSDVDRINKLAESTSKESKIQPKLLASHLDKHVKLLNTNIKNKFNLEENNLGLSDSASSTDSEDFVEVPMEKFNDDLFSEHFLFEETKLPYDTSYQLNVYVDNSDVKQPCHSLSVDRTLPIEVADSIGFSSKSEAPLADSVINKPEQTTVSKKCSGFQLNTKNVDIEKEICLQTNKQEINKSCETNDVSTDVPKTNKLLKSSETEQIKAIDSAKLVRQNATVSKQMVLECQELLRLFGVPWIVAPAEAEAQCAVLEELGLCDGIVTDDSDIFLFGGQHVYRNFFNNSKNITRYQAEDLSKYFGLNRSKLICLGMLCGTDYTIGVDGVGPVTALEILSEFSGDGLEPLSNFVSWYHEKMSSPSKKPENSIRAKLLKLVIPSSFPNRVIFDAYYNANADQSLEPFSWSSPQLSELRSLAFDKFRWSVPKTDAILLPVFKSMNEKQVQTKINLYFPTMSKNSSVNEKLRIKRSKRLNEAIRRNINLNSKESDDSFIKSKKNKNNRKKPKIFCRKDKQTEPSTSNDQGGFILSEDSSSD